MPSETFEDVLQTGRYRNDLLLIFYHQSVRPGDVTDRRATITPVGEGRLVGQLTGR